MSPTNNHRSALFLTESSRTHRYTVALRMACSAILALSLLVSINVADEPKWTILSDNLDCFQNPKDTWTICGNAKLDANNPSRLATQPGRGVLVGAFKGDNLVTKNSYRDCQVEFEFMVPQNGNSGLKLAGAYEIQIRDSWQNDPVTGRDCGGIYPRAELVASGVGANRKYRNHRIDKGIPPKKNVCRKPGEWQTLKITFHSPRFDSSGKKIANAKFIRVELNGVLVHENQEVAYPTGHAWHDEEHDCGPLFFQGDHTGVALRNIRVKAL